jgi:cytochrome c
VNKLIVGLFACLLLVPVMSSGVQAADAAKGKGVFNKCKACHMHDKPKNKLGPHLMGIVGRASGAVEGYKYSKAMRKAELVWDEATLDAFLAKPKKFMKGTKMSFNGLKNASDRANVIEYMKSFPAQ